MKRTSIFYKTANGFSSHVFSWCLNKFPWSSFIMSYISLNFIIKIINFYNLCSGWSFFAILCCWCLFFAHCTCIWHSWSLRLVHFFLVYIFFSYFFQFTSIFDIAFFIIMFIVKSICNKCTIKWFNCFKVYCSSSFNNIFKTVSKSIS